MAATDGASIEEITFDYMEGGEKVRKQLAKRILTATGIWTTIVFLHRSLDLSSLEWKASQITVARFKRVDGIWKKMSSFNINSRRQLDTLTAFFAEHKDCLS